MISRERSPDFSIAISAPIVWSQSITFAGLSASMAEVVGMTAGWAAVPGRHMPSASTAEAMVLAVNMAEQVPVPGSETHSILCSSSMSICTARGRGSISSLHRRLPRRWLG
jgi:hypothetical protein